MLEGLTSAVDESVVLLVVRQLGRCATDDDLVTMVATQGLVPHLIRYTSQSEAPVHTILYVQTIQEAEGGVGGELGGHESPGLHGGHQVSEVTETDINLSKVGNVVMIISTCQRLVILTIELAGLGWRSSLDQSR